VGPCSCSGLVVIQALEELVTLTSPSGPPCCRRSLTPQRSMLGRSLRVVALAVALVALPQGGRGGEMPRASPEDVGMDSRLLQAVRPSLEKDFAARAIPGGVILGARHGKIVLEAYAGYDSPDYIFRLFSQSKPITAVATLLLVNDGVIGLDDPVVKYLPEFRALRVIVNSTMGAPIETRKVTVNMTIRHLLTHTSGLTYGDGGVTNVDQMYRAAKVLDEWNQDLNKLVS
jgi:CubicO group peptidase (beta-lactamase class C family)